MLFKRDHKHITTNTHIRSTILSPNSHAPQTIFNNQSFFFTEECILSDNIYDYYNVSQGKVTIPSMDDSEEFTLTDVSSAPKFNVVQLVCVVHSFYIEYSVPSKRPCPLLGRRHSYRSQYKSPNGFGCALNADIVSESVHNVKIRQLVVLDTDTVDGWQSIRDTNRRK